MYIPNIWQYNVGGSCKCDERGETMELEPYVFTDQEEEIIHIYECPVTEKEPPTPDAI